MQLLHEAESVLQSAGFRTAHDRSLDNVIAFEDDTILGLLAVHLTAESIIESWRGQQDDFLRRNAVLLRRDPRKSWNIYSIFLTAAPVDRLSWELLGIEYDVNATRKVVGGSLISRTDVENALAPIMPLSTVDALRNELTVESLLQYRLSKDEGRLFDMLNKGETDESMIVDWLTERLV